jgi:glycosyltransferase involved in cell wall biosynthesis
VLGELAGGRAVLDLSVIIPARNEPFLKNTVEDILAHARAATEVIAVCDGGWPVEALDTHPRVTVVQPGAAVGQREATNLGARLSRAKYVMKLDAHCGVDEGFDVKLIEAAEALGPDVTQIPRMFNLHVFDWQCRSCQARTYQGPALDKCASCLSTLGFDKVMVWQKRGNRRTDFWRFDHDLHFQYWGAYKTRCDNNQIQDVMSSIGACFFMERARFNALGGLDNRHGSWGQYGVEIACKSWLSGGRHVVNRSTWYSHLFRTQHGFSFPYPLGNQPDVARAYSRHLWMTNAWAGQRLPLAWLIAKFAPIPGWHEPVGQAALDTVLTAGREFIYPAEERVA